jgi:hypothetical protein
VNLVVAGAVVGTETAVTVTPEVVVVVGAVTERVATAAVTVNLVVAGAVVVAEEAPLQESLDPLVKTLLAVTGRLFPREGGVLTAVENGVKKHDITG